MDQETKEIISKQTGIEDMLVVEKTYFECNNDIGATVLKLMNFSFKEIPKPPETQFDEFRRILDEKDTIFQQEKHKLAIPINFE